MKYLSKLLFIPATFYVLIAISSCDELNKNSQYEFYYYPSRNVYYNVKSSEYFYSLDGGNRWDSLYQPSNIEPATLGKKQIIYSNTQQVWQNNALHRKQYGGIVYDIVQDDDTASANIVAERKQPKKVLPTNTDEQKPEEKKISGFRRFTQKLFGKKHS